MESNHSPRFCRPMHNLFANQTKKNKNNSGISRQHCLIICFVNQLLMKKNFEQDIRIELTYLAWKASILTVVLILHNLLSQRRIPRSRPEVYKTPALPLSYAGNNLKTKRTFLSFCVSTIIQFLIIG